MLSDFAEDSVEIDESERSDSSDAYPEPVDESESAGNLILFFAVL